MSVATLLGHLWRRHRLALLLLAVGNGFFAWAITRVVPDPSRTALVRQIVAMAPEPVRVLLGQELVANLSARGFLGFGWVHPFPLILLSVWVVRVAADALAGEVGRGTVDLVASRPVTRASQVTAAALAIVAGVVVVTAGGLGGTALGLRLRPLEGVAAADLVPVAVMCAVLFVSTGAVALAISATRREAGAVVSWCAGLLAGSYVLDYLARVWPAIAALRPLSLFRWYEPQRILQGGGVGTDAAVLGGVAALALAAAYAAFARRDL